MNTNYKTLMETIDVFINKALTVVVSPGIVVVVVVETVVVVVVVLKFTFYHEFNNFKKKPTHVVVVVVLKFMLFLEEKKELRSRGSHPDVAQGIPHQSQIVRRTILIWSVLAVYVII